MLKRELFHKTTAGMHDFPRQCALNEVIWPPKDSRNRDDFQCRLKVDKQRLDEPGVNYRRDNSTSTGQNRLSSP
jgi:N-acetyl-beta-hexosaminidase